MDGVREVRVALTVQEFDEALRLYRDGLGLQVEAEFENTPDGRVVVLAAGRATIELLNRVQADFVDEVEAGGVVDSRFRVAVGVAEVDQTSERLQRLGARIVHEPVVTPWGDRNVRLESPDGVQITLFQPPDEDPMHDGDEQQVVPEIHHVNLAASDPLASADWYGRVLGYRKVREFVSDGEITGVALNHPDGGVRLVLRRSTDVRSGPSLAPIAYSVPSTGDLHALMARISPDDLRGRVFEPATSGALISFTDPDGHRINIYSIEQS